MSSKSHELTATVADMIVNKRLSEQEENILKWAVDEVHKNKRYREALENIHNSALSYSTIEDLDVNNEELFEFAGSVSFKSQIALEDDNHV